MKKGFVNSIKGLTLANTNFREVVYTAKHCQLVVMSIKPCDEIGKENHPENDQFIRIEKGWAKIVINENEYEGVDGTAIVIPAGSDHNIINASDSEDLKLYTVYAPPHHEDGIVRATRADAMAKEEEFDGKTTE